MDFTNFQQPQPQQLQLPVQVNQQYSQERARNNPNMQSLATATSNNINTNNSGTTASGMSFFNQGVPRRSSDNDIGTMDDVQFTASLDALLNGEQMGVANSSVQVAALAATAGASGADSNATVYAQQPSTTQQSALSNPHQYMVTASGAPLMTSAAPAPQAPQMQPQSQATQRQQQQAMPMAATQLAGLPLASATQAALQLTPPGPHSAAQLSLSAGHAAATGAFHPNAPAPNNNPAGMPTYVSTQAPLQWAMSTTAPVAAAPVASAFLSGGMKPVPTTSQSSVDGTSTSRSGKRPRAAAAVESLTAVSEDEGERERRRQERNQREQQRSHKITEQIAMLRDVLSSANQQFKPDKYSTLTKVVDFIQELQDRSHMLDAEHKKLIDTITETNEIVNNQYVPAYTSGSDAPSLSNDALGGDNSSMEDESMSFRGVNYKIAFKGCGIPLALSSIDGRFLDCNDTFLELTGYPREELLPLEKPGCENTVSFSPDQDKSQKKNLSLFNLLSREGMDQVFMAMSEMLKQPGSIGTTVTKTTDGNELADFWSGPVKLCRQDDLPVSMHVVGWKLSLQPVILSNYACVFLFPCHQVKLNVTLVRTSRGRPKFFNCALTAQREDNGGRFDSSSSLTGPSHSLSPSDVTKETNSSGEQSGKPKQEETNEEAGQSSAPNQEEANEQMDQEASPGTDQGGG